MKSQIYRIQRFSKRGRPWSTSHFFIDVKKVFYYFFIKSRFWTFFIFWTFFYFLESKMFILLDLLNSYIKRLLSDGFNRAAIGNSLMKSHSSQMLSCTLWYTMTIILLENFSFGLINFCQFVNNVFYSTFFNVFFIFLIKTRFLTFFILGVNAFYIYATFDQFWSSVTLMIARPSI